MAKLPAIMLVSLNRWAEQAGLSKTTLWRWRKRGWLRGVNVAGRIYLTPEAQAEFTARAEAGEFARERPVPRRAKMEGA